MKSTCTLSALVTVLAAAFIGLAPMASRAAVYAPDSPDELSSDSGSNSAQCSAVQLSLQAGCAPAGMDRAIKTSKTMLVVGGDYQQLSEEIDASSALLEDLVKTGPDRSEENL